MKIVLTNQKPDSLYKTAILDLKQNNCLINKEKFITLDQFKQLEFSHPLLVETPLHCKANLYRYSYNNLDELFLAPRRVYSTLIQSKNPQDCQFEINPSPCFYRLKTIYEIPFSLNCRKKAEEKINISQLNNIVSQCSDFKFQFLDKIVINSQLTFAHFPDEVNGDLIFQADEKIRQLLIIADDFERFELRYINHLIGFGVFARQEINEGDCISFYCGLKQFSVKNKSYFFLPQVDSFNLGIDAREYGNIARFINHAPASNNSSEYKTANLISYSYEIFGLEVVPFFAQRNIKIGEQLLINYSKDYFLAKNAFNFKNDNEMIDVNGKELTDNYQQKMALYKLFAQNGIKQAIYKLITHYLIIFIMVLLFALFLKYSV